MRNRRRAIATLRCAWPAAFGGGRRPLKRPPSAGRAFRDDSRRGRMGGHECVSRQIVLRKFTRSICC